MVIELHSSFLYFGFFLLPVIKKRNIKDIIVPHKWLYELPQSSDTQLQPYVSSRAVCLRPEHLPEIQALFQISYADNAFDPRMLETGQYFGIWDANQLVSISGVHTYSPVFRVAAIGNVVTHPVTLLGLRELSQL